MNAQTSSGTIPQPASISALYLAWSDAQIRADQAFRQLARLGEESEEAAAAADGAAGAADDMAEAIAELRPRSIEEALRKFEVLLRRDGDGQGGFDRADRILAFVDDLELLVDRQANAA